MPDHLVDFLRDHLPAADFDALLATYGGKTWRIPKAGLDPDRNQKIRQQWHVYREVQGVGYVNALNILAWQFLLSPKRIEAIVTKTRYTTSGPGI